MSTSKPPPSDPEGLPAGSPELAARALAFYQNTLRARLEPEHDGEGLAIHPDSGDYLLGSTPTHASRAMRQRHPEGGYITLRVGPTPDFALAARILAGRMQAQFRDAQRPGDAPAEPEAGV
ncbi:MAG: hypothetical protein JO250_20035 [Armatimonadetes bacterium]|nr:hypothetical protein [Armatimonadota bacterium]